MKYVIIGAGGTGGTIAFTLARAGHDVTIIARGKHLEAIKDNGLSVHHLWDDNVETVSVNACTADEYNGTADVILVCVKGYSIPDVIPFISRVASDNTVIVPILNIYTTGETLRAALPGKYIPDGCIYVSANIEYPGTILMHSKILRIIYGLAPDMEEQPILKDLEKELNDSGIRGIYSSNIRRDALKKFSYVSPIGAAGLYYDATAGDFIPEGPKRELFIGMMREIEALATAMGCPFDTDVIAANLRILENQPAETTTSLQRDIYSGGASEIQGLIHDIPEVGHRYGLDMPLYSMVSEALKQRFPDNN